jgi:hypothetical protein
MMSVKSSGGLTRCRGIGKAQRTQWLLSMWSRADYYNAMQELTGVGYSTSDQHSDDMLARKERDTKRHARISWVHIWQKSLWSLTPTLAIFNLYHGVNKLPYIRYRSTIDVSIFIQIKVITKLPNSEQSYKGKVKTHNYINRQNQSTTGKLWKP